MRKTKIVCTLGPATDDEAIFRKIVESGMSVARLNFSHGDHAEHKSRIDMVKKIREEMQVPLAIMLDTKGPEIRIGTFENGTIELKDGQIFTLTTNEVEGNDSMVTVSYKDLPHELVAGNRVLIDDGLIELVVKSTTDTNVVCEVENGGMLSNRKSINLPGISIHLPYMSNKDREDILFGAKCDVDYIAASFVRTAFDVLEIRRILEDNDAAHIQIIAKIENQEGVSNIDDILRVSDGVMVARGDMGVEVPLEDLPAIQKMLIKKSYQVGKKVITATQMLDSMIRNPRPTRAETTDVANAIYDGTSAIMLSGETAVGKYPVDSVKTMARIAERTEAAIHYVKRFKAAEFDMPNTVTHAISHATCTTAHDLGAAAIVTVTKSGVTARMVSSYRPACPIIATTTLPHVYRQLAMSWGIVPMMSHEMTSSDDLFEDAVQKAQQTGIVKNGDVVVITAGIPVGISGATNILKVHVVGDILASGTSASKHSVSGKVFVSNAKDQDFSDFTRGDILVISKTSNDMLDVVKKAGGIIAEEDGVTSHAAIVGLTLGIPVICGVKNATEIFKTGGIVTLDGNAGHVYSGIAKIMA